MEVKILISIVLEVVFLLCIWGIKKAYHNEDALLWLNDYELIEQLQGELRKNYIEKSCRFVRLLIYFYMILFPLVILLSNTSIPFWFCMCLIFLISFLIIYKSYLLQKKFKHLISQEKA